MRVAIWSAVSSTSQAAPDKVSIELQLQKGRQFIVAHGYQSAGEFIVPGESRTRFVSLYHAEKEIPPLHQLLEAAARHQFDLLFVYDLNRFRHLMRQVFDALCDYSIQIYVYTHPREPVPPSLYTEEIKTAVGMIVDVSNLISRSEINTLSRHFREKMPARIDKGLHANLGGVIYGYKKIHPLDKTHPYQISPAEANICIQIKDWFLGGMSLNGIASQLNQNGTPAPKGKSWYPQTVKLLLNNPYYAGIVFFGVTAYHRDRRTGKSTLTKSPNPHYGKGAHVPLWDQTTHQRILEKMTERNNGYKGKNTQRLSSLLRCGECGKILHSNISYQRTDHQRFWRCSSKQKGHTLILDQKALDLIIPQIIAGIQQHSQLPITPAPAAPQTAIIQKEIEQLQNRQKRLLDLYENAEIDAPTIAARLIQIKQNIDNASAKLNKAQATQQQQQNRSATYTALKDIIHTLPHFYRTAPPHTVNTALREIIDHITITKKTHQVQITWRV